MVLKYCTFSLLVKFQVLLTKAKSQNVYDFFMVLFFYDYKIETY